MRVLLVGALGLSLVFYTRLVPPAPTATTEEEAIEAAVENYFAGMMQGKPALLETAFHPESRLIGVAADGQAMIIPFESWAANWEGRAPRDLSTHVNKIVEIDFHGNAASVKTDLVWPNVRYIDYLSLLKVDGEWKIVNKIWTEERP